MVSKPWVGQPLKNRRALVQALVVTVAVLILLPQLDTLDDIWPIAENINLGWLAIAIAALIAANICSALVYKAICPKRLPLARTLVAQTATGFTNRLLPSGLGGLGLFTFYLSKSLRLTKTKAGVIAGINNLIGFLAFCITMTAVAIGSLELIGERLSLLIADPVILIGVALVLLLVAAGFTYTSTWRKWLVRKLRIATMTLRQLLKHPGRLLLGLLFSITITVCTLLMLYASIKTTGLSLPVYQLAFVYIVGMAAITASPTPSGLGAAEVAMSAALGISTGPGEAVAAILVFRLVSFWLPIIPGFIAFRYLSRKHYI